MTPELFVPLDYTFVPERGHELRIAEPPNDALPYIRKTWAESFHRAPGQSHRRFRTWKRGTFAMIDRILGDSTTRALVATAPEVTFERMPDDPDTAVPAIVGWIVWTPGRSISTVHYVYTRHEVGGIEWRRRGVMTALVEAAKLGQRVAYTHKGEQRVGSFWKAGKAGKRDLPRPLDEVIVDWLRARGTTVVYEPVEEWLK
jgi:hypothetical protein